MPKPRRPDMLLGAALYPTKKDTMTQEIAVVVYTKSNCFGCTKTKDKLDQFGIEYTLVDAENDPSAYEYITKALGLRQMPVVEVSAPDGNTIWSGLRIDLIARHITERPVVA